MISGSIFYSKTPTGNTVLLSRALCDLVPFFHFFYPIIDEPLIHRLLGYGDKKRV
jgi:hypothetical protein